MRSPCFVVEVLERDTEELGTIHQGAFGEKLLVLREHFPCLARGTPGGGLRLYGAGGDSGAISSFRASGWPG